MNKFKALVQLQLRGFWLNKLLHQEKKKLAVLGGAVLLLLGVAVSYLLGIGFLLITFGLTEYVPGTMVLLATVLCFIVTFMKGSSLLFGFKDFDLLAALPVDSRVLILSRVFSLYLLNLLFSLLALVPTMILYGIITGSFWPLVGTFLLIPFVPLVPLAAGILLTTGISVAAAKFKHQQIAILVLSLGGVFALLGGSLLLMGYDTLEMTAMVKAALEQAEEIYPLLQLVRNGIQGRPLLLLVFCGVSLAAAGLLLLLLDRYYLQLHGRLAVRSKGRDFELKVLKQRSLLRSLLEKETRLYFSSSLYVMNSMIGVLMFLAAAISLPFIAKQVGPGLPAGWSLQQLVPWLPYLPCLFLAMGTATSAALSMEGKTYWQYATLPQPIAKVYQAKLLLNLLLNLPIVWLGCLFLSWTFSQPVTAVLGQLLLPTCFCLFMVTVGLKLNQRYPRFDWTNEQQVIKQGWAIVLTMLVGFVSALLLAGAAYISGHSVIVVWLASLVLLLLSFGCWRSLKKQNVFVG